MMVGWPRQRFGEIRMYGKVLGYLKTPESLPTPTPTPIAEFQDSGGAWRPLP